MASLLYYHRHFFNNNYIERWRLSVRGLNMRLVDYLNQEYNILQLVYTEDQLRYFYLGAT